MRLGIFMMPVHPPHRSFTDTLAEAGVYYFGDPDSVAKQLRDFYEAAGGFGTLLIVTGKKWATREKVFRSLRLFIEHVAPKLRDLVPDVGDQETGIRNQAFVS